MDSVEHMMAESKQGHDPLSSVVSSTAHRLSPGKFSKAIRRFQNNVGYVLNRRAVELDRLSR